MLFNLRFFDIQIVFISKQAKTWSSGTQHWSFLLDLWAAWTLYSIPLGSVETSTTLAKYQSPSYTAHYFQKYTTMLWLQSETSCVTSMLWVDIFDTRAWLPVELEAVADASAILPDASAVDERMTYLVPQCASARRQPVRTSTEPKHPRACYDLKHYAPDYQVGDKVLKYNRHRNMWMGDKLANRYRGSYVIHKVLGKGVYGLHFCLNWLTYARAILFICEEDDYNARTHVSADFVVFAK